MLLSYTRNTIINLILIAGALLLPADNSDDQILPVGSFSEYEGPSPTVDGWEMIKLGKLDPTDYQFVDMGGTRVVRAASENAVSGLRKRVEVDPNEYPLIQWRWQISNLLERGDVTRKKGDDFAARIFVTFEYDIKKLPLGERIKYRTFKLFGYDDVPLRAINYIWANKAMAGTVVNNAHTSWVKMIAVRDNTTPLHSWISEERNIYEDYEKAFGEKPGAITSIAIMTDTDNTGESTMAYFGDILLSKDG